MKIIDAPQGSDEWLQARLGIATASCFAKVLATVKAGEASDRRNYRAKLVVERLTGKPVETFTNSAMQQGTEREPLARVAYETHTGTFVEETGLLLHDDIEAGASPDGLIGPDGGLEIKCPQLATHLEYLRTPTEPSAYRPQIQGCMWISGRKWWDFVSWNPDFPENLQLVVRRVERDEKYIAGLALAIELFMSEVREEVLALTKLAA